MRLLRSSRRELSDLPNFSNGFSLTGIPSSKLACASRQASQFRMHRDLNLLTRRGSHRKILDIDWNAITAEQWKPHPMFSIVADGVRGKLLQIHLDYHPKQFAA